MKIRPLFKWFGSKWSSAKHYPPPLPGLPIFEPYAGSAGYSLNYCDHEVFLHEDDQNLIQLWEYLIGPATQSDVLDIPVGLPAGTDILSLGLSDGQAFLLKHWQRTNNVGDCWTVSAWGHLPGQWTVNTRARVAEEVSAIKHWRLTRSTWGRQGTHFVDPPYFYNYQYRFPLHERFRWDALSALVEHRVPAGSRVIACEATCPKTGAVPDYLPFVPSHRQVTSRRKKTQNHHSQELVYVKDT